MLVTFNREYLPILGEFVAKEDVRFYLEGFFVKAHPDQGVVLTATDGHRAVVIYDKEGKTDGEYILPISKELLKAAKKSATKQKLPLNQVHYIDNKVMIRHVNEENGDLPCIEPEHAAIVVSHIEYFEPIDGQYPDVSRVFEKFERKKVDWVGVNVDYIGKLKCILNPRFCVASLEFSGSDGSILIKAGYESEIAALVMPCRVDEPAKGIPDFVNYAGEQRLIEEDKE